GADPIWAAANPAGTRVYVTNFADASVSVINTATNTVVGTVLLYSDTLEALPEGVAVHPNGSRVYVATRSPNTVKVIDTVTNTVTTTIIGFPSQPRFIAFTPDGSRAYVSNLSFSPLNSAVSVLDATTNTYSATIGGPAADPTGRFEGIAANPAGTRVYVTNLDKARLSRIETATNTITASVLAGNFPQGL